MEYKRQDRPSDFVLIEKTRDFFLASLKGQVTTVTGTVDGDFMYQADVEFDHNGDGMPEGWNSVFMPGEHFTYDPRDDDPSLSSYSGTFPLQIRVVEYDEYYMPMTPGAWQDFTFTIASSGSNAEIDVFDPMYFSIPDGTGHVDFGTTYVGSPASQTFTIQNNGMDDLTLDASSLTLPSGFSLVSGFDATVMSYSETYFTVQLDATAGGTYQGEISFTNNDTDESPYNFTVTGVVSSSGSYAEIDVFDSMYFSIPDGTGQVDFGTTYVGSPTSQTFTIQNNGMDDLTLDAS
ncbi:MAG: choice-of-anchor D domain-containing protein, partial [Pirellulaceae bacterium]